MICACICPRLCVTIIVFNIGGLQALRAYLALPRMKGDDTQPCFITSAGTAALPTMHKPFDRHNDRYYVRTHAAMCGETVPGLSAPSNADNQRPAKPFNRHVATMQVVVEYDAHAIHIMSVWL